MDPERITVHSIAWLGQRGLGGAQRCVRRHTVGLGIGAHERVGCLLCKLCCRTEMWDSTAFLEVGGISSTRSPLSLRLE